jgi:hypothetical protein
LLRNEQGVVLHDCTVNVRFNYRQIGRLCTRACGAFVLAASPAEPDTKEFLKEVPLASVYYMPPLTEAEAVLFCMYFARDRTKDAPDALKRIVKVGGICRNLMSDSSAKRVADSIVKEELYCRELRSAEDLMPSEPSVMGCMYPTADRTSYTWGFVSDFAQRLWRDRGYVTDAAGRP